MNKGKHIRGWTLSETLVMMIVAGVVFLAVTDGLGLFLRHSRDKTMRIVENTRLYEGYYHLEYLAVSADSASADNDRVVLFRESRRLAVLSGTDSMLIASVGAMNDTLIKGLGQLALKESPVDADTLLLVVAGPDGNDIRLWFPVMKPPGRKIIKDLREQETPYAYE